MPAIRRLAAILAADVAGYSRLMGADEEGTHERLQAHLRELVNPKIAEHRGRVVKNTGDGFLAEFQSVVDAVRCAVEVQQGMGERNAATPPENRIEFRVGINLGDVIVEPHDIFGDGVNVAARLEALAKPGGICVSRMVRDNVRDKLDCTFEDLGEQPVKNIARPVRVFALRPEGTADVTAKAASTASSSPPIAAPRLSIVVLPFLNLSNDPEQEYFADGITDDLTTDLSRISDIFVIARTTAFTYKGKPADARKIGRELGVRYVLEGSVRPTSDQVQLNVQLIDAETGAHVWADRFDTNRTNLVEAQSEITGGLARMLNTEVIVAAGRALGEKKPADHDARDLVMRGWAAWNRPASVANNQEAQRAFERALEIDPGSVQAKILLAGVLAANVVDGLSRSAEEDKARAEQLLLEAFERDANSSGGHYAMGLLRRSQNRLIEAKLEFETSIALDRNNAWAFFQLGQALMYLGQPQAGIPLIEKANRLDPRHPLMAARYWGLGACHLLLGNVEEAIDHLRKARAGNPRLFYIHYWLAGALGLKGDLDEAKAELAASLKLNPQVNSVARRRALVPWVTNPQHLALEEKTLDVGLRRAGFPDK